MASSHDGLEEKLRCPLCSEIFKDPVILKCSHSFCRTCLDEKWKGKPLADCPLCRIAIKRPFENQALKDVCDSYLEVKKPRISELNQGAVCASHVEKHELFCMDDQTLVCLRCVHQDHKDHSYRSISKAAEDHRIELQGPLQELKKKVESLTSKKKDNTSRSTKLKSVTQCYEKQIKEEFEKLHQFLREEEEARITALREEEQQKQNTITENTEEIEKLISDLSEQIHQIEHGDDSLFLQNLTDIKQRARVPVPDPQLKVVSLIDVAKHLGNLRYRVWDKMNVLCPYYPVILEPNSQTSLQVSQDLTTIKQAPVSASPNTSKQTPRFILGSEGFSSGVHTWQVKVESCENWFLGLIKKSDRRIAFPFNSSYSVYIIKGECSWSPKAPKIKKVCVFLDMDKGQLKFTDPDTNVTLKKFSGEFTEKMYPCFFVHGDFPMSILPAKFW